MIYCISKCANDVTDKISFIRCMVVIKFFEKTCQEKAEHTCELLMLNFNKLFHKLAARTPD